MTKKIVLDSENVESDSDAESEIEVIILRRKNDGKISKKYFTNSAEDGEEFKKLYWSRITGTLKKGYDVYQYDFIIWEHFNDPCVCLYDCDCDTKKKERYEESFKTMTATEIVEQMQSLESGWLWDIVTGKDEKKPFTNRSMTESVDMFDEKN